MSQLPVPVHIGSGPPASWDEIEARQKELGEDAAPSLQNARRPSVAQESLDWDSLGLEPRWVGFDTADCVAALQPSIYSGQGADEFDRFRQGAECRGETALVISLIGDLEDRNTRSVFGPSDSLYLGHVEDRISGTPLGKGASVRAADGLGDADGHLARRLLTCNPAFDWWKLSLDGVPLHGHSGPTHHPLRSQPVHHPAQGTLEPIIVTELGEPVVAAWVSPDGVERRYVVPIQAPWPVLLKWLFEQALPEFVPGAMRRARRQLASDAYTMTRREREARAALDELETDYVSRRADLQRELEERQVAASVVREGLLYGTGTTLVDAVRSALESAGVVVVDLDQQLGGTKNADLLCSFGGRERLVEVKSASGSAPERAYEDLVRHLREWSHLPESTPIDGGALIINHQLRLVPQERTSRPYGRPEFLASQTEPVVTTLDLFAAWREEDANAIRGSLFPDLSSSVSSVATADDKLRGAEGPPMKAEESAERKQGWLRRRRATGMVD